ncbi:hypothetical protein PHYPSEUDO_010076 [Phytophthora pseudosyringae]|uniref:HTH psq-type domain-containing protein n=1 Tax=Phytophthora pseudosyringae TaxID=221518 RepID=A0A8T1VE27_9STRA|nr:hypothetical protein PHYPSEUDO_010076 [Phytophthora pseudosyringae]
MAPPPHYAPAARASSVARSLAAAAAALRAQEWRGSGGSLRSPSAYAHANVRAGVAATGTRQRHAGFDKRQAPRYSGYNEAEDGAYDEEKERGTPDREAFYKQLRERHRSLAHRQRVTREFYGQRLQQPQRRDGECAGGYSAGVQEPAKRQRIVPDTSRPFSPQQQQPASTAEAATGQYRSSSYPAPPVASKVNAPGQSMDRQLREQGDTVTDRSMVQQVLAIRPTSAGSGPRTASPGPDPAQVPDARTLGPVTRSKSPSTSTGTPKSDGRQEDSNAQTAPSVIEDPGNEAENDAAGVEDDAPPGLTKQKKRVRYLRDTDRRNIIKRIENGEKQAALAREFGVTRAAICHIKKNRFEILSRYNMLVKSAQEMDRVENFVGPPGVEMMVHEVRANSVLLLMTMLRDSRSNGATFRRVAGRLIMILLEEALAVLGTESVEVITGTGHLYRGLELKHRFCGVAIGAEGFPFLVLFHQMEPEAPQGSIHVEAATDKEGQRVWLLDHMDLPANIAQHKVLLFSSTCSTGYAECQAVEALCSVGCDERSISLVSILVASDGVVNISTRFPQVKIITGGIDGKVDPQTDSIVPGFGDFVSRYNGS